jgi:hypothetical protein
MKATTLANIELDEMLRSLNAYLAVKVVDACYSAQQYVKSPDEFEKAIKATGASYNNCYFMYSSEQTKLRGRTTISAISRLSLQNRFSNTHHHQFVIRTLSISFLIVRKLR